jgi:hypothetical protein
MMRKLSWFGLALLAACARTQPAPATPAPAISPVQAASRPASIDPAPSDRLPDRLSDAEFWKLQADISEPGGYFRIEDNYTSNEMEVGQLFTMLRDTKIGGDVYLGVGPEQNFTYIASIRPRMAFIVDIRRQAVMQHLMFKAMFEMAKDRADFISVLFAKPRPAGIDDNTSIARIWELYRPVQTDSVLGNRNFQAIVDRLTKQHGFTFTADENEKLKAVYDAFYYYGPSITTRGAPSGRGGDFATLTGFSPDTRGVPQSFLSTEDNYRYVKMLHDRNLIVPISGDFGGPKALKAIGSYLTTHHGVVRAFYVSNVEQYLFGDNKDREFYANVATLPVDSTSVFIRPYSMRRGNFVGGGGVSSLCPIKPFLVSVAAGRVFSNDWALMCPMPK